MPRPFSRCDNENFESKYSRVFSSLDEIVSCPLHSFWETPKTIVADSSARVSFTNRMGQDLHHPIIYWTILYSSLNFLRFVMPLAGDQIEWDEKGKYSSVVILQVSVVQKGHKNRYVFCTGTLISEKSILTSSSCLRDGTSIKKIDVFLGASDCDQCDSYEIRKPWRTYEDWVKDHYMALKYPKNDIVVLELTKKVVEKKIKPAKIASSKEMNKADSSKAVVVGWSRFFEKDFKTVKTTRNFGKLKIKTIEECESDSANLPASSAGYLDTYLCADRNHHVFSTPLDIGAPLFNKNGKIMGVLKEIRSLSSDLENPSGIHIFTSIDHYRYYIE